MARKRVGWDDGFVQLDLFRSKSHFRIKKGVISKKLLDLKRFSSRRSERWMSLYV
jgi:hypothetical protein